MQRWMPMAEEEIAAAIGSQVFAETHYLDGKREIEQGAGANKELARDLASFGLDSGGLLIGVEENKSNGTWTLYPVALFGLAERIEQVAQQVVDPPLFVIPHVIPASGDPTQGYVFVEVPESAVAPHMVGGIYYGRGDKTRTRLSDAEVVRYHSRRASLEEIAERLLEEEVRREPMPEAQRKNGHVYLVAQPVTGHGSLARDFVRAQDSELFQMIQRVEAVVPADIRDFAPTAGYAGQRSRRAAGTAMTGGSGLSTGRAWSTDVSAPRDEASTLDIEFREDGGLRVLVGRMTDVWASRQVEIICDGLAVSYALRLTGWAAALGEQVGYRGAWVLGIYGDRLRGLQSHIYAEGAWGDSQTYDADDYTSVTTAVHLEMVEQPFVVAERLVGRLVRGLGTWGMYGKFLGDDGTR